MTSDEVIDTIESIGSKSVKLAERTLDEYTPVFYRILRMIEKWLDSKL